MAEQRSEEAPPGSPAEMQAAQATSSGAEAAPGQLTERINQAYASSGPIVHDDGEGAADGSSTRPSVSQQKRPSSATAARFAAALTAAKRQQSQPAGVPNDAGAGPETAVVPGRPVAGGAVQPVAGANDLSAQAVRRPRRARLRLTHVDPWSVMKTAFLLSIAIGIVTVVAVAVLWSVLNAAGIWDSIDRAVSEISKGFKIEDYLGTSRVLGFTLLVAAVDVVLITVIATLGAFLYNLAAALLGGIEVVLAEDDW